MKSRHPRWVAWGLAALTLITVGHGDEPDAPYEMDRPGDVENPFVIPLGRAQIITYGLGANGSGRESQELGEGGSAVVVQAGVRFGLGNQWEGQIFTDTFLSAKSGEDGPAANQAGLGFVTLRAKLNLIDTDDLGIGLVPFVRLPVDKDLAGGSGAQTGLLAPFAADLGHRWDLEGSTGIVRSPEEKKQTATWESQAGPEWGLAPSWSVYLEGEIEIGQGSPEYALEAGVSHSFSRWLQADFGGNNGLGHAAKARFFYAGLAWNL
jgi:hypothetical protein